MQVRDYERLGLNLDNDTRKKVEEMKTRCGELSIKFQRNLNEENTHLHFTRAELDGMPEDFIKVSLPDRLNIKAVRSFSTSTFSILTGDLLGASLPAFHHFYLFLADSQRG